MAAKTTSLQSGFDSATKTFRSLRPPIHLPPPEAPLSVVDYVISLHSSSPWPASTAALIDSSTSQQIPYSDLLKRHKSLSNYLRNVLNLSPNDAALVICPNCIQVPILYLSLLSLGVVVSPGNPASTGSEISRLVELANPVISFATSSTAGKFPKLRLGTILVDSPEFESMMRDHDYDAGQVQVSQSDVAAILYSSGTTGRTKGVILTHRNLIGTVAAGRSVAVKRDSPVVWLYTMPFFHIFGFSYFLKSVALTETVVVMPRFDLTAMLKAVEKFGVTDTALAPPVVVAMLKSGLTEDHGLWSLKSLMCGGAPLGKDVVTAFTEKFPTVELIQVPPAELEQLLQSHPGIADAAVIPYPDEEAGQVPFALVVRRPGSSSNSIDAGSVMEFITKHVAPYKKIRRVEFVSSIPKNPSGKILRMELRKMYPLPMTSKSKL
ncbi:4-coumarate--CoA ligase-like 9 [Linum perenne]